MSLPPLYFMLLMVGNEQSPLRVNGLAEDRAIRQTRDHLQQCSMPEEVQMDLTVFESVRPSLGTSAYYLVSQYENSDNSSLGSSRTGNHDEPTHRTARKTRRTRRTRRKFTDRAGEVEIHCSLAYSKLQLVGRSLTIICRPGRKDDRASAAK